MLYRRFTFKVIHYLVGKCIKHQLLQGGIINGQFVLYVEHINVYTFSVKANTKFI